MTKTFQPKLIKLNEPGETPLHKRIRVEGIWCTFKGDGHKSHYMIAAHPLSDISISMCFEKVVPISDLTHAPSGARCLVCGLFLDLRKEDLSDYIETRQNQYASLRRTTNIKP